MLSREGHQGAGGCRPPFTRFFRSRATMGMPPWGSSAIGWARPTFDVRECQQAGLDLCRTAAGAAALDRLSKGRILPAQQVDKGRQGTGSLHGRDPVDDRQRHLRHQRHRAGDRLPAAPVPGVFFDHDGGKTHSSGKLLFSSSASFRTAAPGSTWSSTPRTSLYIRIDRRRKLPATIIYCVPWATHRPGNPRDASSRTTPFHLSCQRDKNGPGAATVCAAR